MAVERYSEREQAGLLRAGRAAARTLAWVGERLAPGVSTADIDSWVRAHTAEQGGRPSQLGFHGFPASVCTSINDVVCHGIPRPDVVLRDGDIINIDVTTELDGFHGDTSATFFVGEVSSTLRQLVETTQAALQSAIATVRPGARMGDIGAAVQAVAEPAGYAVVREYCGHGIGRAMHQPPQVPHVGRAGRGLRLREGMAFTIEPMLNLGAATCRVMPDGWTVRTADGLASAQFEHTLVVTRDGALITTLGE